MEIKLFGKSLFSFRKGNGGDLWAVPSLEKAQKLTHLPDFKTLGSGGAWQSDGILTWAEKSVVSDATLTKIAAPVVKKEKEKFTPKRVYEMKMLHDMAFKINMDPKYIDEQILDFKGKLGLMKDPGYNHRGFDEIGSILMRMENRKKYTTVKSTFEKFPYTTNTRIDNVLKKHDYLQMGSVDQFVADMPKEATDAMKEYNIGTEKVCGKKAVFYIIADKKDFQKTNSRRDPILLAQSPFGHFWQIVGAWDKEMLFLEEL